MKTTTVEFSKLFRKLVEDRSVTVLIPPHKLASLTVSLHRRRRVDRNLFESIGESDLCFDSEEAICCKVDDKYGLDVEGNIRVTFLIAPKPKQEYTIIEDVEDGAG